MSKTGVAKHILGFRREYWQLKGLAWLPVPNLVLKAGSFVRSDGGARGRRCAGVRDSGQDYFIEVILIPPGGGS